MDQQTDFPTLQSNITSSLVSTTRSAVQLAAEDLPFHRSLDSALGTTLDRQNARLLNLAERLLGAATANTEIVRPAPRLSDIDAVEGNWRAVVDVVDSLLERADTALDEFTGAVRRLSPGAAAEREGQQQQGNNASGLASRTRQPVSRIAATLRNQDIDKPQLLFDNVPQNDETGPFKPLLQSKPHASRALETKPTSVPAPGGEGESKQLQYPHPYQAEIEQYRYSASAYTAAEPIMYHPFDETTATMVDTEESMYEMLEELKQAKEIAIDLEHHDQRSYIGIVSLMQISTREKDWIVDTLKPWRRKLQCLNEVFTDPSILKVLHGAFMDVIWLQRDLGLYLVGLFDTHYACRALNYPGGGYAYLLKRFADVDAQKQYQMADWRIRPLPQELFDYARSDTHYLLYIYDCVRNDLIEHSDLSKPNKEGDKLHHVLSKSSEIALQRYEYPIYDYELGQGGFGWYKLLVRTPALLTKEQFSVFRAVHQWRDNVAREQDDSVHYVMPNHQIFSIAKNLPSTRAELLGIAQPTSQTVRLRADEMINVIVKAKEAGKDGPDMIEVMNKVEPQFTRRSAHAVPQPAHSVAPFVPQFGAPLAAAKAAPTTAPAASQQIRSNTSTFWGPAIARRPMSTAAADIDLHVPLPPLTAEIFADPAEAIQTPIKPSQPSSPIPTPATNDAQDNDDVFVLGKKRKRPASPPRADDGMAAQSDEVAITINEAAERKKAKKEAKRRAKRAAQGNQNDDEDGDGGEDEQPFDYEAAPSVLNPPRESREEMKQRRKKEVNPYAKALGDAQKGLPRAQRERAGKTRTYKS